MSSYILVGGRLMLLTDALPKALWEIISSLKSVTNPQATAQSTAAAAANAQAAVDAYANLMKQFGVINSDPNINVYDIFAAKLLQQFRTFDKQITTDINKIAKELEPRLAQYETEIERKDAKVADLIFDYRDSMARLTYEGPYPILPLLMSYYMDTAELVAEALGTMSIKNMPAAEKLLVRAQEHLEAAIETYQGHVKMRSTAQNADVGNLIIVESVDHLHPLAPLGLFLESSSELRKVLNPFLTCQSLW